MKEIILRVFLLSSLIVGFSYLGIAQTELISDGSFEGGFPNASWNEFSTNFGTPLCDMGTCGNGGGSAGPHTGNYFAWFGGASNAEIGSLDQVVTIPQGSTLSFWYRNATSSGSGNDYLQVQIDDTPVWTVYEGNPSYVNYTQVTVDIRAFDDGLPHKVEFYSVCYGSGTTNFIVDDVSLMSPPPVPVNWVSILLVFFAIGGLMIYRFQKNRSLILNK